MYLVSACLAGFKCRYDGRDNADANVVSLVKSGRAIPFCPEQAGGCATPRPPCEICLGHGADVLDGRARVVQVTGQDATELYIKGAALALEVCRMYGVEKALLKARSPSCGCGSIYDGTFSSTLSMGDGVTAALLKRSGIEVESV